MHSVGDGTVVGKSAMRRAIMRLTGASDVAPGLAGQIASIADTLSKVLLEASTRNLAVPPPISNSIHDLRGWAVRIEQGTATAPAAVDATRLLAYLRGLPDQQLLALLADLPWARLDALLDVVNLHRKPSLPRSQRP